MNLGAENNRFDTIFCNTLDVSDGVTEGGSITPWKENTNYKANKLVYSTNGLYICKTAHTSGTDFLTDVLAGKWEWIGKEGINNVTQTTLYDGTNDTFITTLYSSQTYSINADLTDYDYFIITIEILRTDSLRETKSSIVSVSEIDTIIESNLYDSDTSYISVEMLYTTTFNLTLTRMGSSFKGVKLLRITGIKLNSLSTADIAEMAMPSEVGISVNSGDTVNANGWLNVGIRSSSDNGAIEIKISNSGVDRYENIRVIGSGLWTANSFAVRKDSTITFNPSNGATIGWASLSYTVGDAKALGLL